MRVLRVVSYAAPRRRFPDEAAAKAALRALDVGPFKLAQVELGKTPAPFWLASLELEAKKKFEEKGSVVVHVAHGWMARLAWTREPCIRCEVP